MRRQDLEHLVRASASITNQYEFVIVGSQSILGAYPDAPAALTVSRELDIYPLHAPELADLIDGAIGELSPFDEHYGYYAQGVGPTTAILPQGWRERLVKVQNSGTDLKIGWCLDPLDLAASKLAAGREKDHEFVKVMLTHGLAKPAELADRLSRLPVDQGRVESLQRWVQRAAAP